MADQILENGKYVLAALDRVGERAYQPPMFRNIPSDDTIPGNIPPDDANSRDNEDDDQQKPLWLAD